MFICCHSVKWIPSIYELYHVGEDFEWPLWIRKSPSFYNMLRIRFLSEYVNSLSNFLPTINSSVNIFIYFIKHYEHVKRQILDQNNRNGISTRRESSFRHEKDPQMFQTSRIMRSSTFQMQDKPLQNHATVFINETRV